MKIVAAWSPTSGRSDLRENGTSFLEMVGKVGIRTVVTVFPLDQANEAIARLRRGEINGAAVLAP